MPLYLRILSGFSLSPPIFQGDITGLDFSVPGFSYVIFTDINGSWPDQLSFSTFKHLYYNIIGQEQQQQNI